MADGSAKGLGVVQLVPAARHCALVVFGHRVANAGPQVLARGTGNDAGVDKNVHRRHIRKRVFAQGPIRVVQDAKPGAGSTGRGNGGEGEQRFARAVGQYLGGVDGFAAAHGKNHICLLHAALGLQPFDIFYRGFAAVPVSAGQLYRAARYGSFNPGHGRSQRAVAANHGSFGAIWGAHLGNIGIGILANCIIREPLNFHFVCFLSGVGCQNQSSANAGCAVGAGAGAICCFASLALWPTYSGCSFKYLRFLYTPTVRNGTMMMAIPR
ncbi:hypothetical protein SDC9_148369 [bioreactor metagenome]|uniref:Uncharacterized protein n=1 Tax=bioreactor metagenome TaxID=1076179 RepID=A0A645EKS9_9ZZZZ